RIAAARVRRAQGSALLRSRRHQQRALRAAPARRRAGRRARHREPADERVRTRGRGPAHRGVAPGRRRAARREAAPGREARRGDQFASLFPASPQLGAERIMRRLAESVADGRVADGKGIPTIAWGVADAATSALTVDELVDAADRAMYRHKQKTRARASMA